MNRQDLLKQMRESIGTQDPVVYFDKLVTAFEMLFDRIDSLEEMNHRLRIQTALAVQWDPKIASDIISKQVNILRKQDSVTFASEIDTLKLAFAQDVVTQNYDSFCTFWLDTLGYHPFLD